MTRIFLSHASVDKPIVRRLAEALRVAGHEPWVDEDEILVGESIPRAVERGLREADFVIVCLSTAAAERGWVEAERDATVMQQFQDRSVRILPVRFEPVDPPCLIAHLRYVDLFPGDDAFKRGIQQLARSISTHSGREAESHDAPEKGRPTGASAVASSPLASAHATHADTSVERWRHLLNEARRSRCNPRPGQHTIWVEIDRPLQFEPGLISVETVGESTFELMIPLLDGGAWRRPIITIRFAQVEYIEMDDADGRLHVRPRCRRVVFMRGRLLLE